MVRARVLRNPHLYRLRLRCYLRSIFIWTLCAVILIPLNAYFSVVLAPETTQAATFPPNCKSERVWWQVLGYTQVSWDNWSGEEQQPWSSIKYWSSLTPNEKAAAEALGFNGTTWDNDSGFEPRPASADKPWSALIACADGEMAIMQPYSKPE